MRYAALLVAASLCSSVCRAQQIAPTDAPSAQAASQQNSLPVLRVYANLIQIPVLVLSSNLGKVSAIASDRFSIRFDKGPWFKAANVHLEGDDPIDLAIVIDARGPQAASLLTIDRAIANLAPALLHSHDRISIYVMACDRVRSVLNVSADPVLLKTAVNSALTDWNEHREKKGSVCSQNAPLWDLLTYASNNLSSAPGRRVILTFTNGDDNQSTHTWNALTNFAQNLGVTIFAINPESASYSRSAPALQTSGRGGVGFASNLSYSGSTTTAATSAGDLPDVCELTGGIMLRLGDGNASDSLTRVVQMLRERYIVDFPRPANMASGVQILQVKIDRGNYFIRPAGNAVPVANPDQKNDPSITELNSSSVLQLAAEQNAPAPPEHARDIPAPAAVHTASPQTLDEVLSRVNENVQSYLIAGPDIFADEHAAYAFVPTEAEVVLDTHTTRPLQAPATRLDSTRIAESTFFLRHHKSGDTMELLEARDEKSSNFTAGANIGPFSGTTTVTGLFSLGLWDFSPDLRRCYDYRLETDNPRFHNAAVMVLDYSLKAKLPSDFKCPVTEEVAGRAFIDPSTMQVLRIEQRLPKHEILRGTVGLWTWAIDYAPVDINGQRFWLPQTVTSESFGRDGQLGQLKWSFVANYRNYHQLTVHSTILPAASER